MNFKFKQPVLGIFRLIIVVKLYLPLFGMNNLGRLVRKLDDKSLITFECSDPSGRRLDKYFAASNGFSFRWRSDIERKYFILQRVGQRGNLVVGEMANSNIIGIGDRHVRQGVLINARVKPDVPLYFFLTNITSLNI